MLEHLSIPRYTEQKLYVTMRWVQTISRKDSIRNAYRESSETVRRNPTLVGEDTVRPAWRHAEAGRNDQLPWWQHGGVTTRAKFLVG